MISELIIKDLQEYIDEHYIEENQDNDFHPRWAFHDLSDDEDFTAKEPDAEEKISLAGLGDFLRAGVKGFLDADEDHKPIITPHKEPVIKSHEELKEKISSIDEGFGRALLREIDMRGMSDAECYNKAQLNRSHFNKIKNDPNYHVQKETVFAFALALSMDRDEAEEFLAKAGYAFAPNSKLDLIVQYCIENEIYDLVEVNRLLYEFDQKLLGAGIKDE